MTVDTWFRNPHNYIRELAEVGESRIAWDRGLLVKRRIDAVKHAETYFRGKSWKVMLIGEQGSAVYTNESPKKPVAVYPTWDAAVESLELLEEMMMYPVGEDSQVCNDPTLADDERPVSGQEHRIVIINIPEQNRGPGRAFMRKLAELNEDYPNCIIHLHGLYSWRISFGMGFGATDIDPRTNAAKGRVTLPSGKDVFAERTASSPNWITLLGMTPVQLTKEPRNRCIYNIKSALWAAENYMENIAFATRRTPQAVAQVDTTSKTASPVTTVSKSPFTIPVVPQPTDKISCNTCTLQDKCKYFREGSVCSVPGSEPASLAKQFGTRDADMIIDGLGSLMKLQANRLERGVAEEELFGELDPEVTKIVNQIFTNGVKLAKLVDPSRFAGPKVQVNVGAGGAASVGTATNPKQLMGSIVRELESRGIPRDQITPEMVTGLLQQMGEGRQDETPARVIEGKVISRD